MRKRNLRMELRNSLLNNWAVQFPAHPSLHVVNLTRDLCKDRERLYHPDKYYMDIQITRLYFHLAYKRGLLMLVINWLSVKTLHVDRLHFCFKDRLTRWSQSHLCRKAS